ncbi:glycoside hydrolase family 36 protein [Nocardioides renjunii]|uniref:glycoside hydrolase family 36 protein n=1 Tax=Nocardioides renjunii TaxID=3095075 RepID=UPI002AFF0B70|nr:glycoside hydrolase family 36 protein [Nocardioides sp. S-34]WQQ20690.1 glycoside hydrolase family 36 protein [Nocardioides sp. S-34]
MSQGAVRTDVVDEVPVDPRGGRVYAEGWQSWSPATWYPVTATGRAPAEGWQHLMRFRPGTPVPASGVQGEGLLVVDPGTGAPARCYATDDLLVVPSIHATLEGDRVVVRSSGPVTASEHPAGGEAALVAYGDALAATSPPLSDPPTVWCSWYRFFEAVTAADVAEAVRDLDRHELGVDVVLVDDGWSAGFGELLRPSDRFGSLPGVVEDVRASGRRAGAWLAPFLVGADTTMAREHPDWLVGPAGYNWGQDLVGLDLTHPGVREVLADSLRALLDAGVDYLKLDFLYGGAVPGRRHEDVDEVAAYRSGLQLVRDVVGPDVLLVGCGAPLLPSVGLVDAMRVSPDTFHEGGEDGSGGLRGLMPIAARAWQQGRLWVNDPDCVVVRPSYGSRERWAEAAQAFGGLRSFSDRISELDAWGLDTVRGLLADGGTAAPLATEVLRRGARVAQDEGAAS